MSSEHRAKSQRDDTEAQERQYRDTSAAQVTLICVCAEVSPHLTVMGQLPGVVVAPTFHVQLTLPAPSDTLLPSPAAPEGPFLYTT